MREINEPFDPNNEAQFIQNSGLRIDRLLNNIKYNLVKFRERNKDFQLKYRIRYDNSDYGFESYVSRNYQETVGDAFGNNLTIDDEQIIKDVTSILKDTCESLLFYGYRPDSLIYISMENRVGDKWEYKTCFDSAKSWYYYMYHTMKDKSYASLPDGVGTFVLFGTLTFPEDLQK